MDELTAAALASQFIGVVGRRWTLEVLALLLQHGHRYQEIYDALDGISYKVLTETLRRSERDGLVFRRLAPDRVETATLYQLTEMGRSLFQAVASLAEWADDHWNDVQASREQWDATRRTR